MSCYEWETGTIRMGASELSKVQRGLASALKEVENQAFDLTQTFWRNGLTAQQRRDASAYSVAVYNFIQPHCDRARTPADKGAAERAQELFDAAGPQYGSEVKARRVLRTDLLALNNKALLFTADDLSISLDRAQNLITWDVRENNRAVERAHDCFLGMTFWNLIDKVRFGRGHGGIGTGNNEYNGEGRSYGGGANYATWAVGPVGKAANEFGFRPYLDSNLHRVGPARATTRMGGIRW